VVARLIFGIAAFCAMTYAQASIEGRVTDPSGAAVAGAVVEAVGSETASMATTSIEGRFRIDGLTPGPYKLKVASSGFAPFESAAIELSSGRVETVNVRLQLQQAKQNITVSSTASELGVDPSQNAGQIVLRGSDLDAFSDNPEDLANELQMLAGPAPGPDGGQIFIDGFSAGIMPPKASIREVRVNQNPFSAEYDRVGFGRIDVLTKPGSDKYHGQASFDFANRDLTARNPFLISPIVPNYRQEMIAGNFGGPLGKRASFFIDADRRLTDENAVVTFTTLDTAFNPVPISTAVIAPSRRFSTNPRLDFALTPNHTLTVRYSRMETSARNQGINTQTFDEASQAFTQDTVQQSLQVAESSVLGARTVNDIRFQLLDTRLSQGGISTVPELDVLGAFTSGGTFPLNYTGDRRYEFQDNATFLRGSHTIKFGGRLRNEGLTQQNTSNFNGRFIFSGSAQGDTAIDVYQQNQILAAAGYSQAEIAAQGFGPSEFLITAGNPRAHVNMFDAGLYLQDDWRLKPNISVSGGIRYEGQTAIADHADWAPRVALAWAPGRRARNPKTVIRAALGLFYDRFPATLLMNATLLNGINQTQYIIRDPAFYPTIPDLTTIAALAAAQAGMSSPVHYQIDSALHVPYVTQTAAGIERQLPHGLSLSVNYTGTRGVHELLTRDINAPLPTVFNSEGMAIGPRPFGAATGDIYQYEGSGVFRQNEVIASVNAKISSKLTLYGYYVYNHAMSDTDGPASMPANAYNLREDYSRAAFDFRQRAFISATTTLPLRIRMAPFLFLQSGLPYNVTSGVDTNGDGNPNDDRPAFATDLSRPTVIDKPGFGVFDTAPGTLPGAVLVPRNYLEGPGILSLTVRVSRSWSFGESGRGGGNTGGDEIRGGDSIRNGGLSGGSNQSGLSSVFGGFATARRYALTLTASFRNALNNVNPALPIGNLSSPYFGRSVTLNTFGPLPGAGPNAGAGNRHIELQARLTF
jgi:Carboxypeptidase regulatory-like domain